jgi:hypothetical protein
MSSIVGKMQDMMSVNFHCRMKAMMNPEKNVATAWATMETLLNSKSGDYTLSDIPS